MRDDIQHHYTRMHRALAAVRFALKSQTTPEAQATGCRNAVFALDAGGDVPLADSFQVSATEKTENQS